MQRSAENCQLRESVANIIAEHISSIEDVSFNKISEGSLCSRVAEKWKVKCDTKLRNKLRCMWQRDYLRETVSAALQRKSQRSPTNTNINVMRSGSNRQDFYERTSSHLNNNKKTEYASESVNSSNRFEIIRIKGDGNCLFRCLSHAVFGTESRFAQVRDEIVRYVVDNWEEKNDLLNATCEEFKYKNAEHYALHMGSDRVYGTDFELAMFVNLFEQNIKLFKIEHKRFVCIATLDANEHDIGEADYFKILFTGDRRKGHFEVLKDLSSENNTPIAVSEKNNDEIDGICQKNYAETTSTHGLNETLEDVGTNPGDLKNTHHNYCSEAMYSEGKHSDVHDKTITNFLPAICTPDVPASVTNHDPTLDDANKNLRNIKQYNEVDQKITSNVKSKKKKNAHAEDHEANTYGTGTFDNEETNANENSVNDYTYYNDDHGVNNEPIRSDTDYSRVSPHDSSHFDEDIDSTDSGQMESSITRRLRKRQGNKINQIQQTLDIDNTSHEELNLDKKKVDEKIKKENIYKIYVGMISVLTEAIASKDGYLNDNFIRDKIDIIMCNEFNCSCPLGFYGGVRANNEGFVAYARCLIASHKASFRFDILEIDCNVTEIHVSSDSTIPFKHGDGSRRPFRPIRGTKRNDMKKLLRYQSARNVQLQSIRECDKELFADGHTQNVRHLQTLHKVRSEARCENKLQLKSRDIEDMVQLYMVSHTMKDSAVKQFSLPLQILLFTEKQLDVINRIRPAILHLDATGANVRKPQFLHCKKIFYYSLLYRATKSIIPICEMFTSEHDITSVSIFLKKYRAFVEKTWNKWPFVDVIVVDWSWVFMRSILFEWNYMSIETYLQVAYQYVTKNERPKEMIVILSCCAHNMHRVSKTIKKDFPELIKIKHFLMECMALMILSRTLDEMDMVFTDLLSVTLTKDRANAESALLFLSGEKQKKRDHLEEMRQETDILEDAELQIGDEFVEIHGKSTAVYANSPFYEYYWKKVRFQKDDIEDREKYTADISNEYYAPAFADYLTQTFMPYCPLWSGMMLDLVDKNISRVTNAYAESYMQVYKATILEGKQNFTVAEGCRMLQENNECLVQEEKLERIQTKSAIKISTYPLYAEAASNPFEMEKWGRKRKDITDQRIKRKRNVYMEGRELIKIGEKITGEREINDVKIEKSSESLTMSKNLDDKNIIPAVKKKININKKHQLKRCKTKKTEILDTSESESFEHEANESQTGCEITAEYTDSVTKSERLDMLENGMIDSVLYYMGSTSAYIKLGVYSAQVNLPLAFEEFQVTAREFASVVNTNRWVDGQIIDSYTVTHMDGWDDVTYMPTDIGCTVIGNFWEKRKSSNLKIYQISTPLNGKLLMPYALEGHWRLLVADIDKKSLILMDPYKRTSDFGRVTKAFQKFLHECDPKSTMGNLRNIDWKVEEENNRPFQESNDGSNCALYVMHYIRCIGNNVPYGTHFEPKVFRQEVAETLILNSQNIRNRCIHCLKESDSNTSRVTCTLCQRWLHSNCAERNEMNTEDEESEYLTKIVRKRSNTSEKTKKGKYDRISLNIFTCRLCKRYKIR